MKSVLQLTKQHSLARHEDRAQRSPARNFPQTDYHFHAPAEDMVAVRDQRTTASRAELRAFRQISDEYLGEKSHRGYLVDMIVFAMVTGVVAATAISLWVRLWQIS